jgi:lactoylglutathione lyase
MGKGLGVRFEKRAASAALLSLVSLIIAMKNLALLAVVLVALRCASTAGEAVRTFHLPSLYHVGFWVRDIAKSRAFYKDFLGYEEPYELRRPNGDLQMVVMKVNERQVIYLFNDATKIKPSGDNLDHLGLETDHIESARDYLLTRGVKVGNVNRGRIGDFLLGIRDPDGNATEITQFAPEGELLKHQGRSLAPGRISDRLRGATIATPDLAPMLRFYQDILGFEQLPLPNPAPMTSGAAVQRVRLRVPEGTDYLELVAYELKPGAERRWSVPDYTLGVKNAAKTFEILVGRAKRLNLPLPAEVAPAADGRPHTSVIDPDGVRVIFEEESPAAH